MNFLRVTLAVLFSAALVATPAFASHVHKSTAHGHTRSLHKTAKAPKTAKKAASKSHKLHGQQAIDSARVTEIQQALIREHYLTTEADGRWDGTTEAAMKKYQADQGWQTKLMPDSRALKKLGLGPDYSNAINAKDSSFAVPATVGTTPAAQESDFAAAAGVSR